MSSSSTTSVLTIILNAFQKMGPRSWLNNPMLAVVFIVACLATALFLKELNLPTGHASLYAQMLFWIWMTLFFSTLADSYAESKLSYKDLPHKQKISTLLVKRLANISNIETFKEIELSRVKSGNFLLLRGGDIVPFDGIIVKGICYVNETSITGGLDNRHLSEIIL